MLNLFTSPKRNFPMLLTYVAFKEQLIVMPLLKQILPIYQLTDAKPQSRGNRLHKKSIDKRLDKFRVHSFERDNV